MEKVALFGCGNYGKKALWEYGKENVVCFIDNSKDNQGKTIEGIPIISLDDYKENWTQYDIVISATAIKEIKTQLDLCGIKKYRLYLPKTQYYRLPCNFL